MAEITVEFALAEAPGRRFFFASVSRTGEYRLALRTRANALFAAHGAPGQHFAFVDRHGRRIASYDAFDVVFADADETLVSVVFFETAFLESGGKPPVTEAYLQLLRTLTSPLGAGIQSRIQADLVYVLGDAEYRVPGHFLRNSVSDCLVAIEKRVGSGFGCAFVGGGEGDRLVALADLDGATPIDRFVAGGELRVLVYPLQHDVQRATAPQLLIRSRKIRTTIFRRKNPPRLEQLLQSLTYRGLGKFSSLQNVEPHHIMTVIPAYNEPATALDRTLLSLATQDTTQNHCVVILDGWHMAHPSMKARLQELFPDEETWFRRPWWDLIRSTDGGDEEPETFLIERLLPTVPSATHMVHPETPHYPPLTLIVKRQNRRKHNSHQWFFSLVEALRPKYAFCTDVGTILGPDCLTQLVDHLDENHNVVAVTGRQRVMMASQQLEPGETESAAQLLLRLFQLFDYESSLASFMGAFALSGLLPVIPGPCGLFRTADIEGEVLAYYFDMVNADPRDIDLVLGNLLLAEDRVLTYASVFKTGKIASWVPSAIFFFEAETTPQTLLPQRRRWTNGSIAGWIYLFRNFADTFGSGKHNIVRVCTMFFFSLCQLLLYVAMSFSPAIFTSSFYLGVRLFFVKVVKASTGSADQFALAFLAAYVLLFLTFTGTHARKAVKLEAWLFWLGALANVLIMLFNFYALGTSIYEDFAFDLLADDLEVTLLAAVVAVLLLPFALALITSLESFLLMVVSAIPFYLFLPTYVALFSYYALARSWDLTWGNRPSSMGIVQEKQAHVVSTSHTITALVIALNVLLGTALVIMAEDPFVLMSVLVIIFVWTVVQMLASLVWLVEWRIESLLRSSGRTIFGFLFGGDKGGSRGPRTRGMYEPL